MDTNTQTEDAFLALLERDLEDNPGHAALIPVSLRERANRLVEGIDVDLTSPLPKNEQEP
ncbi:hypothetical protein HNP46_000389 [Pseudomonas nitritireducens]|uniref:Antitoxin PrlF n=1 Tax=Pseudomonas nitroreducens TaxID=46680 RepID=A0A7W7NYD4_PSENT|nr:type II toxin-antitoxin system PrlF family antitoxin [Pseudomonas nitritireducens]MBB4861578.1 hypothetical protein [Pseudomonas nitritireducens]